jgi:hypothetical protein
VAGLNSKPRATDSHAASLPPAAPEPLTTDTAPEPEEEAALVPDPVAENAPTATQSASDMPPVRRNPLPSTRGRPGPASRPLELTVVRLPQTLYHSFHHKALRAPTVHPYTSPVHSYSLAALLL